MRERRQIKHTQTLPNSTSDNKRFLIAAVLIWALSLFRQLKQRPKTADDVFTLTGATKTQTYEILRRLKQASVDLGQRPGRPIKTADPSTIEQVLRAIRDFLFEHPGAVSHRGSRHHYAESFQRFVLSLTAPGGLAETLTVEQLADASGVPLGTLKGWLKVNVKSLTRKPGTEEQSNGQPTLMNDQNVQPLMEDLTGFINEQDMTELEQESEATSVPVSNPELATIIDEWNRWEGSFSDFCRHLKKNLHIDRGTTFVGNLLEALGLRKRKRRGRNDPPWSRGTFRGFFPGAQWIADGKQVKIEVNGETFVFNWEAQLDVASNGVVGIDVRDTEDSDALIEAFQHGVDTTGKPPLAQTVDNKPSNLSPQVEEALQPTVILEATPNRGQAKAPLEGTFGLFSQTAPPLKVEGKNLKELAKSIATLVLLVWCWARNFKPRARLKGCCPAPFYQDNPPTEEQIEEAKKWFDELNRRQEKIRQTKKRRSDPVRRKILNEALAELGIENPKERVAVALSSYSIDAILRGISVFKTKKEMGTLPPNALPERYLGGIIRNINKQLEQERTAELLLELRIRHHDLSLAPLQKTAERLIQQYRSDELPQLFVLRALECEPIIEFRFWAKKAAYALSNMGSCEEATSEYKYLVRIISRAFRSDEQRRDVLIARLSDAVLKNKT